MKNKLLIIIVAIISLQCSNKETLTQDEMRKIVNENNERLGKYFMLGNPDSLASMYNESAVVAPNGDDFYSGLNEILNMYKTDLQFSKILKMDTETISVNGNKEIIYETGKTYLTISLRDSVYKTHVKFCNIWLLQNDGSYKLDVDIWNQDRK